MKNISLTSEIKALHDAGGVYVDKTKQICSLMSAGDDGYILARPRKMGKTLLLSTIEAIYSGKKEYFRDTYIYDKWNWKNIHPVIRLDMGKVDTSSVKNLEKTLNDQLFTIYKNMEVKVEKDDLDSLLLFSSLITECNIKYKEGVVILIDNHGHQLTDPNFYEDDDEDIWSYLTNFYGVIKAHSARDEIHFTFLTGITNLIPTSIFSGLNNLEDISYCDEYSDIIGFTENEVQQYFVNHIEEFAQKQGVDVQSIFEQLKEVYNGYRFTDESITVYSPWSILNALKNKQIKRYYDDSGLLTSLKKYYFKAFDTYKIENLQDDLHLEFQKYFEIPYARSYSKPSFSSFLYAHGYISIKEYDKSQDRYILGLANKEIEECLLENILQTFTHDIQIENVDSVNEALDNNDTTLLKEKLNDVYTSVSCPVDDNNNKNVYYTVTYALLASIYGTRNVYYRKIEERDVLAIMNKNNDSYVIEYVVDQEENFLEHNKIYDSYDLVFSQRKPNTIYSTKITFDNDLKSVLKISSGVME